VQAKVIDSLTEIAKTSEFESFANQEPGGIIRSGRVIKFLVDNRKYPHANVYYLNSNYCQQLGKKNEDTACNYVLLHREFTNHQFKLNMDTTTYFDIAYNTSDLKKKKFIDGRVQIFEIPDEKSNDPEARKSVYGIWFIERDLISEEALLFTLKQVKESFKLNDKDLIFVRYNEKQTSTTVDNEIAKLGIGISSLDKILMGVPQMPLNKGVAYGYLRWEPKGNVLALEPTDIPVFHILPLDLGVVAASITTTFQDVASHINLKAKERKTPNIAILSPALIETLKPFIDQPIRLEVTEIGFTITPSSAEEIVAHQPKVESWQKARTDLSVTEPILYSKMCSKISGTECLNLAGAFGGKAMQLGFLATDKVLGPNSPTRKEFKYPLSPSGFGIPIYFFNAFMEYNKKVNPNLEQDIQTLVKNEKKELIPLLKPEERIELISKIQTQIRNGVFPPELEEKIYKAVVDLHEEVKSVYGYELEKVKVRSSANVEDIAGFDGAGLHDSYSAKVDAKGIEKSKTQSQICNIETETDTNADANDDSGLSTVKSEIKPKTIICAIKGVYASIFNARAVGERSYHGFDHESAMMGIAVVPSYKSNNQTIVANSVLLTRVLNTTSVYGYQLATQQGNNLATNPTPGTMSEMSVMTFQLDRSVAPTITIQRHAKVDPKPEAPYIDKPLLDEKTMINIQKIGRVIEEEYCRAKKNYFAKCDNVSNSAKKERSLDMEVKIYSDSKLLFKQFREFSGK
jgi:hypothetical protein